MANEIGINIVGTLINGEVKDKFESGNIVCSQSSAKKYSDVKTIATSDTTITFGSLTQAGWFKMRNLDPTNYIDMGPDATGMVAFLRLLPLGPEQLIYVSPGAVIKAKANSAACKLDIKAWDA